MYQGVEYFDGVFQGRRYEDLVDAVLAGLGAPALPDMAAASASAGKAARDPARGDCVAGFGEDGC